MVLDNAESGWEILANQIGFYQENEENLYWFLKKFCLLLIYYIFLCDIYFCYLIYPNIRKIIKLNMNKK